MLHSGVKTLQLQGFAKAPTASPTDTLHASAGNWKWLSASVMVRTPLAADVRHLGPLANKELKLQALVYDILPSTTAAIGPRKLSANGQFFVGVQTVVSWLQTTQIK